MDFPHAFLVVVAVLAVYVAGISLMTTQVSYPLYSSVPAGEFVAYHARYNRRIQPVIIMPALPTFVAFVAFPFLRPGGVPVGIALLVAAGGAAALVATAGAAVPAHLRLQRDGFTAAAYRRLRTADAFRTAACVLSAGLLIGCLLMTFSPRG